MLYGERLFQCGIGVLVLAGIIGIIFLVLNCILGKKLKKKLVQEYGEKRHR